MPTIARGQENTPTILNWFVTVGTALTDVAAIDYRIIDIHAGLPGIQVFPAVGFESVVAAPGHFDVGSYYAYDNANAQGYTPPYTLSLGTYRIEWRWQLTPTSPVQTGYEDFTLVADPLYSPTTYITVADIRAEGLDATVANDTKVQRYIEIWQAFLERACRQWFLPRECLFRFDGTDSDAIHFGVPIISIDYIKVNNDENPLDANLWKTYSSPTNPVGDDRHNPRLKLVGADEDHSIFTTPIVVPYRRLKFRKGRQNQEVKGMFGYVEANGEPPELIKRALTKLVVEKLVTPIYGPSPGTSPPLLAAVLEETTDGHSIKYAPVGERVPWMTGITTDQEILDIIRLYKAPIGIATPNHYNYG